jgi:sugar O-acyltransferase (sialic acid O-acetyltransferase NeuD family)
MASHSSVGTPERLAIFGAGGHAREAALIAERMGTSRANIAFVVEAAYHRCNTLSGIAVHTLESGACDGWPFVAAVGDPLLRERVAAMCIERGMIAGTLHDPSVFVHESVRIGQGCIIASGAILTVDISLGEHVHVNVGASISHDTVVGEFSTVSPGVRIAGHVALGRRVFMGIGATIVNGTPGARLVIGDDAVIAAGACVVGPVAKGLRVMGVPAKAR